MYLFFFFQAEDGIRDLVRSRGLGDVYKRQHLLSGLLPVTGYGASYLVGISGACFALLLALATLSPHTRLRFMPVSGKNLGLGIVIGRFYLSIPCELFCNVWG